MLLLWLVFRSTGEDGAARTVDACDVQASFGDDPSRMAPAVDMDRIVPGIAVQTCETAVRRHGSVGRFRMELARAYMAAGEPAKGLEALKGAMRRGYPAAWLDLGRVYADHWADDGDLEKAAAAFRKAGAGGIDVTQDLNGVQFSPDGFSDPAFMKGIWTSTPLDSTDHAVRIYLQEFMAEFESTDGCSGLVDRAAYAKLTITAEGGAFKDILTSLVRAHQQGGDPFAAGANAAHDSVGNMVLNAESAGRDAQYFFDHYGCDTPVAHRFFAHLRDLVVAL